jgi:hypothetical protein
MSAGDRGTGASLAEGTRPSDRGLTTELVVTDTETDDKTGNW